MSEDRLNIEWKSPGPVSTAFMHCDNDVEILNGPIGAGKTRTVFIKAIRRAQAQRISTLDGKRKFKLCVVHANYRQLWRSTLESWFKLMPRSAGDFIGTKDGPATHAIAFALKDGTIVDFRVDFIAIGENAAEDVMRGYEPTAFYLNECDLLAEEVFTFARGRAGRFPDMSEGGPSWFGILADCNAPQLSSWLYKKIFRNRPPHVALYRQPSGLSPYAENVPNLPPGYYPKQIEGQDESYVARMVENKPGYSSAGKAVYRKDFSDSDDRSSNVARISLPFAEGLRLQLGLDAGGSPAGLFGQRMPNGQWRILRELVTEPGTGPVRFGQLLAQALRERFEGARDVVAWCDPSATYGADKQMGEQTWLEIVAHHAGIRIHPAPSNEWFPRYEAVRVPLSRRIDNEPALLIDPACEVLREGFNSGYRYRKLPAVEGEKFSETPEKNEYSHVHDALQYLMLGGGEDSEIRGRKGAHIAARGERRPAADHDWDPMAA